MTVLRQLRQDLEDADGDETLEKVYLGQNIYQGFIFSNVRQNLLLYPWTSLYSLALELILLVSLWQQTVAPVLAL